MGLNRKEIISLKTNFSLTCGWENGFKIIEVHFLVDMLNLK